MPNFTPILNLIKPLAGESFSVNHANDNADKIEAGIPIKTNNAQAIAGTNDVAFVTPLTLRQVIDSIISIPTSQNIDLLRGNKAYFGASGTVTGIPGISEFILYGEGGNVSGSQTLVSIDSSSAGVIFTRTLYSGIWTPWYRDINSRDKANQAQAIAMTDDATYMTPLRTAESIGVHANNNTHVFWLGNATGTNTLSTTYANITSYTQGLGISFSVATNTTAAATLRVNSLAYVPILNSRGTAVANLRAGGVYTVRYSGTNFILQGEGGEYGTATAAQVLAPNTFGTENGLATGTMVNRGVFNLGLGVAVPAGFYSGGTTANGKRSASGNLQSNPSRLVFNGLSFKPTKITAYLIINRTSFFSIYDEYVSTRTTFLLNSGTFSYSDNNNPVITSNTGFDIPIPTDGEYRWEAFE